MRIPTLENDLHQLNTGKLSAQLLDWFAKLNNTPLLIDKLTLSTSPNIQLDLLGPKENVRLFLPVEFSNQLAKFKEQSPTILINQLSNRTVMTVIEPNNPIKSLSRPQLDAILNSQTTGSKAIDQLTHWIFKQVYLNRDTLKLSNPVTNSSLAAQPQSNSRLSNNPQSAVNRVAASDVVQNSDTSPNIQTQQLSDAQRLQTINRFIAQSTETPQPPAKLLSQLLQKTDNILSMSNSTSIQLNQMLSKSNNSPLQLSQAAQQELLMLVQKYSSPDQLAMQLSKVQLILTKLIDTLAYNNANIAQAKSSGRSSGIAPISNQDFTEKLFNSGLFFEQKLAAKSVLQNEIPTSAQPIPAQQAAHPRINTASLDNQLGAAVNKGNIESDLKYLTLQLRQQLSAILSELTMTNAKPITAERFLFALYQSPAFMQQLFPTERQLIGNISSEALQAHQQSVMQEQAKQIFQSTQLKTFPWHLLGLMKKSQTPANAAYLIETQKSLLLESLRHTNGLLRHIESSQLSNLRAEFIQPQQFLFSLPLINNQKVEQFEFKFQQHSNKRSREKSWSVTIRFDLEPLGAMFARVSLKDQRISTQLYAKESETANLLAENIDHLKDSLLAAGVQIDEVSSSQGKVPESLSDEGNHRVNIKV